MKQMVWGVVCVCGPQGMIPSLSSPRTVINKKPEATLISGIPSPSGLLEELRRIDFEDAKATVPSVSRCLDVNVGLHRST